MYNPTHFSDRLEPILWGNGNGKGDEHIGDAKVRLKTFIIGGKRVFVAPGFTKCAAIKFLPVLAKIEKSWSLFKGSSPAPSISFFNVIWCFLYLLVGLYAGSPWYSSSSCSLILNFLLILSTIEWSKGWLFSNGFSIISLLLVKGCCDWYFEKLSLNEDVGSSLLSEDSLSVGSFFG